MEQHGNNVEFGMADDLRVVLRELLEGLAESHLELWQERYYRKAVEDIETDLYVNYDPSLEFEAVEEELDRKLEYDEMNIVKECFNESVLNEFRNREDIVLVII